MKNNRFCLFILAYRNICHQKLQSVFIFLLLFVVSASIFAGGILTESMRQGLERTKQQMGADVIVVPNTFVTQVEDALFQGKPCTVNFEASWQEKLGSIQGVADTSTQLFLASMGGLDCCDDTVQLIAVNPREDFTVGPWLVGKGMKNLESNELVAGCKLGYQVGDTAQYFGKQFQVVQVMEETGMGYDSSAFISYEAAGLLAEDEQMAKLLPFEKGKQSISMVQLRLKPGYTPQEIKSEIEKQYPDSDISVYASSSLLANFTERFQNFQIFGRIAEGVILFVAAISFFIIFVLRALLRQNEMGTLLSLGIGRGNVIAMLIWEYVILIVMAVVTAVVVLSAVLFPFQEQIRQAMAIPYVSVSPGQAGFLFGKVLLIDFVVCLAASVGVFWMIYKKNPVNMVKEVAG